MEKYNVIFVFVPDTCKQMSVSFLHLLVKHSALQLPCYLFSSLVETFPEYRKSWSKKMYLTDYRATNSIQLIVAIKRNFSGLETCR